MSINQLVAYTTIITIFKIKSFREPLYLARRLGFTNGQRDGILTQRRHHDITKIDFKLARGRESFLYQGSKLWNSLDLPLKMEENIKIFKQKLREWILNRIPALP